MKKRTPFDKLIYVLMFLPLIVAIILYSSMPDKVPIHYGADGMVDKMGNKPSIFFVPLLSLICVLPINLVKDFVDNKKLFNLARLITVLIMDALCFAFLYLEYNNAQSLPTFKFSLADVIFIICGIFLIVVGIRQLKIKQNYQNNQNYSIIKDEEILEKVDKLTSKVLIICGVIWTLAPICLPSEKMPLIIYSIVIMCIVPIVYTLYLNSRKNKK